MNPVVSSTGPSHYHNWSITITRYSTSFVLYILKDPTVFMTSSFKIPQFLLRLALGIGFLSPVADRLGFLGPAGPQNRNVDWGDWQHFIDYTSTLMPFLSRHMVNIMGSIATIAEVVIGILLIIGFKTRLAAIGSCILTLTFALCMSLFLGLKAPLNYSVFPVAMASLLLAAIPVYHFSIDHLNTKTS